MAFDIPPRPMHRNHSKRPQSDADFMRFAGPKTNNIIITTTSFGGGIRIREQPKVVDSVSCRQMFLRSYTFSRKESFPEKTKKRFGKIIRVGGLFRHRTCQDHKHKRQSTAVAAKRKTSRSVAVRRVKESSYAALFPMFQRFLFCTSKVDVI